MTMTYCEEVTSPPPPSQGALISAVGWDLIKTLGFLSTAAIRPLKSPCSASAKSAILPVLSAFIIYSLSVLG